jgi:environmental stress-induced protein Ves
MRVEVLRAAARQAVAWRNGGGVTREVAVWPAGAGMDAFEWRVSMAEVGVAGPFSVFAGVDRVLTVVSGVLALRFGARDMVLDAGSAPFGFAGDVACDGAPVGGPVVDLNVMTRRGVFAAGVARVDGAFTAAGAPSVLVALRAGALRGDGVACGLAAHDAAVIQGGGALVFDAPAVLIAVRRIGAA